jgi:hypothetical protein
MRVGLDYLTFREIQKAKLLGEIVRRKEVRSRLPKLVPKNYGEQSPLMADLFDKLLGNVQKSRLVGCVISGPRNSAPGGVGPVGNLAADRTGFFRTWRGWADRLSQS